MDPAELAPGLAGLIRIRNVALRRESAAVLADFHAHTSASLARQARWCRGRVPLAALRLWHVSRIWRAARAETSATTGKALRA